MIDSSVIRFDFDLIFNYLWTGAPLSVPQNCFSGGRDKFTTLQMQHGLPKVNRYKIRKIPSAYLNSVLQVLKGGGGGAWLTSDPRDGYLSSIPYHYIHEKI